MNSLRKMGIGLSIIVLGIFVGGCVAKPADMSSESPTVILEGKLVVSGDGVVLSSEGKTILLDVRKVDVKGHEDTMVKVTGEYSGTTLFVDKIEK